MEKVKITKEQAEAVEHFKRIFEKNLKDMTHREFYDAFRYGYEVEPEFEKGQWAALDDYAVRPIIAKILEIDVEGDGRIRLDWSDHCWWGKERIRHATPEEIAAEKERRWWAGLGRGKGEYKEGDIINVKGKMGLWIVYHVDKNCGFDEISYEDYDQSISGHTSTSGVELLVVPVENRLDVSE